MRYKYSHGITVGRYRPYHKGHRYLHRKMLSECSRITIILGSAQEEDTFKNPFTIEEVKDMIKNCLSKYDKRINFISVKDINNIDKWSLHILKSIKDPVDAYYAGTKEDATPFLKEKNLTIEILNRQENDFKSGTQIRDMMYKNNPECFKHVPRCNWHYIRRLMPPA